MARESNEIDRDKLRAAIRRLGDEYVRYMLDDAIGLLPPAKLRKIAKNYIDLNRLRPDPEKATKANLLADVRLFEKASLAGEYYESFAVNSKNYTHKSAGTSSWIAAFHRLLDRCVTSATRCCARRGEWRPRSSARHWLRRRADSPAAPATVDKGHSPGWIEIEGSSPAYFTRHRVKRFAGRVPIFKRAELRQPTLTEVAKQE